jgi:TPR repeat protein
MVNLKKSAAQNNSDAIMSLAELSDNPEEAFMYYSKAANLGNSLAQCNIASMYLNGIGTSVDYKEALSRFLIAANDHQENALRNIGDIYYYGLGVPRNVELARNYYSQAIFEGDVLAMENDANMNYENGEQEKAVETLLSLNLDKLSDRSLTNLGNYYYNKHDYTSAVNYLERVNNLDKGTDANRRPHRHHGGRYGHAFPFGLLVCERGNTYPDRYSPDETTPHRHLGKCPADTGRTNRICGNGRLSPPAYFRRTA